MLGKRSRMRRTSSVSLIGSGCVISDGSPLPELLKEGQKPTSAPRQVIGFHPKEVVNENLVSPAIPVYSNPPHRTSPNGSPRSGLGDLLANSRPWDRKEGVGLGIVASLSSSQEDVRRMAEEIVGHPIPTGHGRRTSPQAAILPSAFAPPRASPPIPIMPHPNSGHQCSARCNHQNCVAAFGVSSRPEMMVMETSGRGSRPNNSSANTSWSRSNPYGVAPVQSWGFHADMEVDRSEPQLLAALPHSSRANIHATPTTGFVPNFLDACYLCRRRLGEGSDIYIYRGDKAFCSPECRHQQIVNDERPEKCSSAVMKMGGPDVRTSSQRNRVMAAGTAAAA